MSSDESQRASGMPPKLTPEEEKLVADLVADGLSIQDEFRPEPMQKQSGKGHFDNKPAGEIRRVKEQQPNGVNHERE